MHDAINLANGTYGCGLLYEKALHIAWSDAQHYRKNTGGAGTRMYRQADGVQTDRRMVIPITSALDFLAHSTNRIAAQQLECCANCCMSNSITYFKFHCGIFAAFYYCQIYLCSAMLDTANVGDVRVVAPLALNVRWIERDQGDTLCLLR